MASEYGEFCAEQRKDSQERRSKREVRADAELYELAKNIADLQALPPSLVHDYWTLRVGGTEARHWTRTGATLLRLESGAMDRKARYYEPRPLVRFLRNEDKRRRRPNGEKAE